MSYSEKVVNALNNGELDQLSPLLDKAIKNDADEDLEALYEVLLMVGFLEETEKVVLALQQRYPNDDKYNIPLAEIAIENDDIEKAFEYLEAVSKESDAYIESLIVTADLYQVLGIPEVSQTKLQEAQKLAPNEPIIQFALAELYYSLGDYEEALPLYKQLREVDSMMANVSLDERIGVSLSMNGEFEEAIPYLEHSLEEVDSDDHLFQLAYTYMQMEEYDKAIQLFQKLREENDTYQSLYFYLGTALKEEQRLDEAKEVVESGLKMDEYQVRLYQLAAEIAYMQHDIETSESYLKQAIELGDGIDQVLLSLANLYITEERFEEAIPLIKQMDEIDGSAEWALGQAYRGIDDYDKAIEYYDRAAEEMAHDLYFMRDYGLFLREQNRQEESRRLLLHYLEHMPDDFEIETLLADDQAF